MLLFIVFLHSLLLSSLLEYKYHKLGATLWVIVIAITISHLVESSESIYIYLFFMVAWCFTHFEYFMTTGNLIGIKTTTWLAIVLSLVFAAWGIHLIPKWVPIWKGIEPVVFFPPKDKNSAILCFLYVAWPLFLLAVGYVMFTIGRVGYNFQKKLSDSHFAELFLKFIEARKSADGGDMEEQYNLAMMYFRGTGTVSNETEAYKWLVRSAEQGYLSAQLYCGTLFFLDKGANRNLVQSYVWLSLAAAQGASKAYEFRKKVIAEMSSSDIEKAEKQVAQQQQNILKNNQ